MEFGAHHLEEVGVPTTQRHGTPRELTVYTNQNPIYLHFTNPLVIGKVSPSMVS